MIELRYRIFIAHPEATTKWEVGQQQSEDETYEMIYYLIYGPYAPFAACTAILEEAIGEAKDNTVPELKLTTGVSKKKNS